MIKNPRRRALVFSGGGLDTVMQLGVAHALLVSRSEPPDYVVGVSAGAVNAAALAEILQAGPPNLPPEERESIPYAQRLPFQVDRLRTLIGTYLDLPRTFVDTVLPDGLEILARDPLTPLELPIHFDRERHARDAANDAKAGLVRLMNDLFGIRVTVGTGTRIVRRFLGLADAGDEPNRFKRFGKRIYNEGRLLALLWSRFPETGPLMTTIGWAYLIGPNRAALSGLRGNATADRLMRGQRVIREAWAPLRMVIQHYVALHMLAVGSLLWLGSVVAGAVFSVFDGRSPRPWRWLDSMRRGFRRIRSWLGTAIPDPTTRILQFYGLADGLANTDVIKQLLVRSFDPHYYGKLDLPTLLNRTLDRNSEPTHASDLYRKRLSDYRQYSPGILVAPIAADVDTGRLEVLDPNVPVVDALLAATAAVPLFPAVRIDPVHEANRAKAAEAARVERTEKARLYEKQWRERTMAVDAARASAAEIPTYPPAEQEPPPADSAPESEGGKWYIDGTNISNEALAPLIDVLRRELESTNDDAAAVDVYRVSNLPMSGGKLPAEKGEVFDGILAVAPRALQLQRFRDATIEQQLTELYTRALPKGRSYHTVPIPGGAKRTFVNAHIFPLELERPVGINYRLLTGQIPNYTELIYQTIADGCRATLEGALPSLIRDTAKKSKVVGCAAVMMRRLDGDPRLPGSDESDGPGLSEVCRRCALVRRETPEPWESRATLRVPHDTRHDWPQWPRHGAAREVECPVQLAQDNVRIESLQPWPAPRGSLSGTQRPLVSLLFGGGVFRGVFHMGVTNALSELGIHPDIVAGSSVGSIIAAMIAQVFASPDDRRRNIAHLAATFLSIDKLIMTDRLADFIRRFTLRAADTPVSLRDLDLLFRRYDADGASTFNHRMRTVAAGIERLSYVSPFELIDLARDVRMERFSEFMREIRIDVQDFLDRNGIGQEIFGSEPLVNLIEQHVLSSRRSFDRDRDDLFESFRDRQIFFLATATNLEDGRLEILGESVLSATGEPSLRDGLLASSAFPAVFRPRRSWEIFRNAQQVHNYIDGGVIDNLPLTAVSQFLDRASRAQHEPIARRPIVAGKPVPHLIFTASLERDPAVRTGGDGFARDCIALWKRARTLKYNRKIDSFASTQEDLRIIHSHFGRVDLLDLHVMAVKPKWLCSTFGFHPMLGFRRRKQAQSIAHGCASTFATVHQMQQNPERAPWLAAWGVRKDISLDGECFPSDTSGTVTLRPRVSGKKRGDCWFRVNQKCPFYRTELEDAGLRGQKQKVRELSQIYELCGNPRTHEAQ